MSENKVAVMNLTDQVVTNLIDELARMYGNTVTPALVYKYFQMRGFYNQRTGKPFSRQSLYNHMRTSPTDMVTRMYKGNRPLLVISSRFPVVSNWLHSRLINAEVIDDDKLTPMDCTGRDLYGFPSLQCAIQARSIHMLYADKMPVTIDMIVPFIKYTFKVVTWNVN